MHYIHELFKHTKTQNNFPNHTTFMGTKKHKCLNFNDAYKTPSFEKRLETRYWHCIDVFWVIFHKDHMDQIEYFFFLFQTKSCLWLPDNRSHNLQPVIPAKRKPIHQYQKEIFCLKYRKTEKIKAIPYSWLWCNQNA